MSYINIHKVEVSPARMTEDAFFVEAVHEGNEVSSTREGEELMAAARILSLVDDLDNGEALVIRRVIF